MMVIEGFLGLQGHQIPSFLNAALVILKKKKLTLKSGEEMGIDPTTLGDSDERECPSGGMRVFE